MRTYIDDTSVIKKGGEEVAKEINTWMGRRDIYGYGGIFAFVCRGKRGRENEEVELSALCGISG